MRLSKRLLTTIKEGLDKSFSGADVYLFGSRTDDTKRGGDIDIAIDTKISRVEFRKRKIRFIIYMLRHDLDLKIDLVRLKNKNSLLESEILENGILL